MSPKTSNQFRIIGGRFRSRRLAFPDSADLRPTGDRIRETLFNWLAPHIEGARCLDLFAGSGALGFEALSRGARSVCFVDHAQAVCTQLNANLSLLSVNQSAVICHHADLAIETLNKSGDEGFDIVFLDPPFKQNALQNICDKLEQSSLLHKGALIYVEQAAKPLHSHTAPDTWHCQKDKTGGNVHYRLYRRQ